MNDQEFFRELSEEMDRNYRDLKHKLDMAMEAFRRAPDNRAAKGILIEVQGNFKGLRLRHEDRDELYGRLQEAFREVNGRIEGEKAAFAIEAARNYNELKIIVEAAISQAGKAAGWQEARSCLIDAQQAFRGLRLISEQREALYKILQQKFDEVNAWRDREVSAAVQARKQREIEEEALLRDAAVTFPEISEKVMKVKEMADQSTDFKNVRELLRIVQAELRDSRILREQKDGLYNVLQEAFETINQRQDQERSSFEADAAANYKRLSKLVGDGLLQAQESNEYKETREFLKKIQSEFKGIRMVREQREELYSRLQSAFDTLNQRLDTYFREKQKNWEVRMNFKLKDLAVVLEEIDLEIKKEEEELLDLSTQLDIIESSGKETSARYSIMARMESVRASIRRRQEEAAATAAEMENLRKRLEGEGLG